MNKLLITSAEVLEYAFSSVEPVDPQMISTTKILLAQERFIRPVLNDLYETLFDKNEQFCNDYIKAPLAYYVRSVVLEEISINIGSMGAVQSSGAYSEISPLSQQTKLRRIALSDANTLIESVIDYIESNPSLFPEYKKHKNIKNRVSINGGLVI